MSTTQPAAPPPPPAVEEPPRLSGSSVLRRFVEGDLASFRVVIGLVVIWIIFQVANSSFLTARNLTNLVLQITGTALISVGIVLVLLIAEIDLSVGAASGLAAGVMAVLNVKHGWAAIPAIGAGVLVGTGIGFLQGMLATRFGIPSFIITLAGLLAWQGALLQVLGSTGTINLTNPTITGLANTFYSTGVSWVITAVAIGLYAAAALFGRVRRERAGLESEPIALLALRIGIVAAIGILTNALIFTQDRGLPLAVVILIAFIVLFQFVTTRTRFGRHVYAVGGSDGPIPRLGEAARRAGIHVTRVRVAVFMIAGTMAAVGGIMEASYNFSVSQSSGASDVLLFAIAGPVIAGTSLFGGRGSVWSALIGGLVIGSISNGMDLLALNSAVKFMVTGGVLAAAVIVDAIARRQRQRAGRV